MTAWIVLFTHMASLVPAVSANPRGGSVISGSASIAESGSLITINQATDKAIVDWQGFSNAAGETVRFQQPAATSATLNRVTGTEASVIQGAMQANGRVFLINPNGVVFGKTATVDTGGLVASTLQMTDSDFNNGRYRLQQEAGKPLRSVVNQGSIRTSPGGSVALVAPVVNNEGTIVAPGGRVGLAAGTNAVVNLDGAGLVSIGVRANAPGNVVVGRDAVSSMLEQVVNSGSLVEAGSSRVLANGEVELRGAEGVAMNQGTIRTDATQAGQSAGRIEVHGTQLTALGADSVTSARGAAAGTRGGTIHATGQNRVGVFEGATVTASGRSGGGTVKIGGPKAGESDLAVARSTYIAAGAQVSADAETCGDGGTVIARADRSLLVNSKLTARGRNGFVETSASKLQVNATPEAATWLIDPVNITITGGCTPQNVTTCSPFEPVDGCSSTVIDDCQIVAGLQTGNVVIRTNNGANSGTDAGNIIWDSTALVDFDGVGTRTLTLEAQTSIVFNGQIFDSCSGSADRLNVVFQGAGGARVADFIQLCSGALINTGGTALADLGSFTARAAGDFRVSAGAQVITRPGVDVSGTIDASRILIAVDDASRVVDLAYAGGGSVQNNVASTTSGFSTNAAVPNVQFHASAGTLEVGANDAVGLTNLGSVALESDAALVISAPIATPDIQLFADGTLAVNAPVSTNFLLMRLGGAASGAARIDAQFAQVTLNTADAVSLNLNGNFFENNSACAGSGFSFGPMSAAASKLNFTLDSGALPLRIGTNSTAGIDDAGGSFVLRSSLSTTIDAPITAGFVQVNAGGTGAIFVNAAIDADTVKFQNPGSTGFSTTLGGSGPITAPNVAVELVDPNAIVNFLSVNGGRLRANVDGIGSGFSFAGATPTALTLTSNGVSTTLTVGSNLGETGIENPGGSLKMEVLGSLSVLAPIRVKDVELRAGAGLNVAGNLTADTVLLHVDAGSSELFPGGPIVPHFINASGSIFTCQLTVDLGDSANLAFVNVGFGLSYNSESPTSGLSFFNAPAGNPSFLDNLTVRVGCGPLVVGANFGTFGIQGATHQVRLEASSICAITGVTGQNVTLAGNSIAINAAVNATCTARFEVGSSAGTTALGLITAGKLELEAPVAATISLAVDSGTPCAPDIASYNSTCGLSFASDNGTGISYKVSDGDLKIGTGGLSTTGAVALAAAGGIQRCGLITGGSVDITDVGGDILGRCGIFATAGTLSLTAANGRIDTCCASVGATGDVLIRARGDIDLGGVGAANLSIRSCSGQVTMSNCVCVTGNYCVVAGTSYTSGVRTTVNGTAFVQSTNQACVGAFTAGDVVITTGGLMNVVGDVKATAGSVTLGAGANLTLTGSLCSGGGVTLSASGDLVACCGPITASGVVEVDAGGTAFLGTVNAGSVDVDAGAINLNGSLTANGGDVALRGTGSLTTSCGAISATGDVSVDMDGAATLSALSGNDISLTAGGVLSLCCNATASGDFRASAGCGLTISRTVTAGGEIFVESTGAGVTFFTLTSTGAGISCGGNGNVSVYGRGGDVTLTTACATLGSATAANGTVLLCASNTVCAINGTIVSTAGYVELEAGCNIRSFDITAGGTVRLVASTNIEACGTVNAGDDILAFAGACSTFFQMNSAAGGIGICVTCGDARLGNLTAGTGISASTGCGDVVVVGALTAPVVALTSACDVNLDGTVTASNGALIIACGSIIGCAAAPGSRVTAPCVTLSASDDIANADLSALRVSASNRLFIAHAGTSCAALVNVDAGTGTVVAIATHDLNTVCLTVSAAGGTVRHDLLCGELTASGFTCALDLTFANGTTNTVLGAIDLSSAGGTGSLALQASGLTVTQTAALKVNELTLDGGTFTLCRANTIARLSGCVDAADITFTGDLIVGDGACFSSLVSAGLLTLTGPGALTGGSSITDLVATTLTLTAGSLGTGANALGLDARTSLTATASTGGANLSSTGALDALDVVAATDLAIASGTLTLRNLTAGGDVTLAINGDVNQTAGGTGIRGVDGLIDATGRIGSAASPLAVDLATLAVSAGAAEAGVAARIVGTLDTPAPTLSAAGFPTGAVGLFNGVVFPTVIAPPATDPVVVPPTPTPDPVTTAQLVFLDSSVRAADAAVSLRTAGKPPVNNGSATAEGEPLIDTSGISSGDDQGDGDGSYAGAGDEDEGNSAKKKAKARAR